MKLKRTDLIKLIIRYLQEYRTPIKVGIWMRNIKSAKDHKTLTPFVQGNTLDILAAMIEDGELIRWPYSDDKDGGYRWIASEGNSTITLLEEGRRDIHLKESDISLKLEGGRLFHEPLSIREHQDLEEIRTPEGFLKYAEMMDDIKDPEGLVNEIFSLTKELS